MLYYIILYYIMFIYIYVYIYIFIRTYIIHCHQFYLGCRSSGRLSLLPSTCAAPCANWVPQLCIPHNKLCLFLCILARIGSNIDDRNPEILFKKTRVNYTSTFMYNYIISIYIYMYVCIFMFAIRKKWL